MALDDPDADPVTVAEKRAHFRGSGAGILLAHGDGVGKLVVVAEPHEQRGVTLADAGEEQLAASHLLHVGDARIADGDAGDVLQGQRPLLADTEADRVVVLGQRGDGDEREAEEEGSRHDRDATGARRSRPSDNWRHGRRAGSAET